MVYKKIRKDIKDQRIDTYLIPSTTIEKMNELNYNTYKTGREHGMSLCLNKENRIVPGKESIGDDVSINVPETCKSKNDKFFGSFHTHPRPSETKFSAMDLWSSCSVKSKLDCVGMNRQGEIVCFSKKDKNRPCEKDAEALVQIENIYGDLPYGSDIPEAVLSAVDKLVAKKFTEKKIL